MAEFEQFLPNVTIHISSCPRLVVLNAIKSVVREFLQRSSIWVFDCPVINVVDPTQHMYPLDVPFGTTVSKVWSVKGRDQVAKYFECPISRIDFPNKLMFEADIPTDITSLNPVVSLSTTQDSLACPDIVYQVYHDAIVNGSVAYLQSMPGREWSQPNDANTHQRLFEQAIQQAIFDVDDGFGLARRAKRVRPYYK